MTAAEWEVFDKTPGAFLYDVTTGRRGRLVSHIQYGATVDFTKQAGDHIDYSYLPFALLSESEPEKKTARKPVARWPGYRGIEETYQSMEKRKENQEKYGGRRAQAVRCVETGKVYASAQCVAEIHQVTAKYIRLCIREHGTVKKQFHFEYVFQEE